MLSNPRHIFGVHSFTAYKRTTGEAYGTAQVLGGSSLSLTGELVKLNGGSQKYPWSIQSGLISSEITVKFKQYEDWQFEVFMGKAPTSLGIDAAGAVSTLTDKFGTSVADAVTGIASVSVIPTTGAANLKFGKYVLKATSASAVSVFSYTDIDFARGTDGSFLSDDLAIATAQTITTGGNTDLAAFGLRLTGGSGAIAMVSGDTATFEVKPPSSRSMEVLIGATTDVFPEFGAIMYGAKMGDLSMVEIDAFRVKGSGLPIGLEENAFSEAEVKCEAFYDAALGGTMKIRWIIDAS